MADHIAPGIRASEGRHDEQIVVALKPRVDEVQRSYLAVVR